MDEHVHGAGRTARDERGTRRLAETCHLRRRVGSLTARRRHAPAATSTDSGSRRRPRCPAPRDLRPWRSTPPVARVEDEIGIEHRAGAARRKADEAAQRAAGLVHQRADRIALEGARNADSVEKRLNVEFFLVPGPESGLQSKRSYGSGVQAATDGLLRRSARVFSAETRSPPPRKRSSADATWCATFRFERPLAARSFPRPPVATLTRRVEPTRCPAGDVPPDDGRPPRGACRAPGPRFLQAAERTAAAAT